MADISTWSPVDANNNQPPPDGWPEGMAPSGVNNSARAVMGAVRRFYDQTINGTLSLPYLPLTGGTVTGSFYAPNVVTTGYWLQVGGVDRVFAGLSGSDFVIYDAVGQPTITMTGSGSYYRNGSHTFQDEAGATLAAISAGGTFSAIAGVSTTNVFAGGYFCDALQVIDTTVVSTPSGGRTTPTFCNETGGAGIQVHSANSVYISAVHIFTNSGGGYAPLQASAFNVASDRRLKENIEVSSQGLPEILKLSPVSFTRRNAGTLREVGFVAQDVAAVLPQAVTSFDLNGETTLGLSDMPILAALVNAVKDLATRVESLSAKVETVERAHAR